jgi:hypothetical protein
MKNLIVKFTAVMMLLAVAALASTVKYDYDRTLDFSPWKRMAWKTPIHPGASMTEQRLQRAIEDGFAAKSYRIVDDPAGADFLVDFRATAWRDVSLNETFSGRFGRDLSMSRTAMGALVVDVFDARTGRLAWRGMVSDALENDPDKADKKTAKAVRKLLEKFPPPGEKP